MVQLSKADGYSSAMENIYHLIFIWDESNQGEEKLLNKQPGLSLRSFCMTEGL